MKIATSTQFFSDLSRILTQTVDGFFALGWCFYFLVKAIYMTTFENSGWTGATGILFIPVILLFVVRLRINDEVTHRFNFGSFASVNFFCLFISYKGVV